MASGGSAERRIEAGLGRRRETGQASHALLAHEVVTSGLNHPTIEQARDVFGSQA
jgi:hypothetical protein